MTVYAYNRRCFNIVVLSLVLFIRQLPLWDKKKVSQSQERPESLAFSSLAESIQIKMRSVYTLLPVVATVGVAASQPSDSWVFGNSLFYLGPPSGNSRITKATYSILPPSVPSGSIVSNKNDEVWVSVWVGASPTAGDHNANLYQPLFNWSPDQESQYVELEAHGQHRDGSY